MALVTVIVGLMIYDCIGRVTFHDLGALPFILVAYAWCFDLCMIYR